MYIGDKVRLIEGTQDLDDSFAEREFTVVGFVNSSYYTCSTNGFDVAWKRPSYELRVRSRFGLR